MKILTSVLSTQGSVARSIDELKITMEREKGRDIEALMESHTQAIAELLTPFASALLYSNAVNTSERQISNITEAQAHLDVWTANLEDRVRLRASKKVLGDLRFQTIAAREEQIQKAYETTYEWIFRESSKDTRPWDSFTEWLKSGSGIYWVNGKAASGKSTLMRYVSYHEQTQQLLRDWAGHLGLDIGRFYFWNSGTPEQRSQAGLFRSLLFEGLLQHPDLIPVILPSLWKKHYSNTVRNLYLEESDGQPWEEGHNWKYQLKNNQNWTDHCMDEMDWPLKFLMDAFTELINHETVSSKICLFVDGLDEYEGDHPTIAALFEEIAKSPNVKVCVSSRPLLAFSDAFKGDPSLRLQDLTERDIVFFITSNFEKNSYYQQFARDKPDEAKAVVQEIVSKADGVFLWVTLVVYSLLEGLRNRDDVSDLKRRIDLLPPDLERLFHSMLLQIPDFYRKNTSELFQIVRSAREYRDNVGPVKGLSATLDLITLSLSDEADPELAIKAEFKDMTYEEIGSRCRTMEDRLKVRTMGLLEVYRSGCPGDHRGSPQCGQVQYVHRTVRDYLESPEIKKYLVIHTRDSDFNANTSLLRGYIRRLKANIDHGRITGHFVTAAMIHAHFMEVQTEKSNARLLNELKEVRDRLFDPENDRRPFQYAAIEYTLCSYVDEALHFGKIIPSSQGAAALYEPLLYRALCSKLWETRCPLSLRMVSILLQRGANPNEKYKGISAWILALTDAYSLSKEYELGEQEKTLLCNYADILKLFLERGADVKAVCKVQNQSKTGRSVVKETFRDRFPGKAAMLDAMFEERGGKLKVSLLQKLLGAD
jgi:hypothetical protein